MKCRDASKKKREDSKRKRASTEEAQDKSAEEQGADKKSKTAASAEDINGAVPAGVKCEAHGEDQAN